MTTFSPLNWKEIGELAAAVRPKIEGLFVDRIVVPERARFRGGYVKNEWAIRLVGRIGEGVLIIGARPRRPYFYYLDGKGPKAAPQGTRSPFDLELSKRLKGRRLTRLEHLTRERTVVFWFEELGLALNLIPAQPEALLLARANSRCRIITRSRITQLGREGDAAQDYVFPDGSKAPDNPPVRQELVRSARDFSTAVENALETEAFELRSTTALRELRALVKQARERIRSTEAALREARGDADWQRYGDLLKASIHSRPELEPAEKGFVRRARDYETGNEITLPSDPKLTLSEQVEKYYQLARRRARRISEATSRIESISETLASLKKSLDTPPADWGPLERLEQQVQPGALAGSPSKGAGKGGWLGKTFSSKDGLAILIGKSRDENLELTFKRARGNDVWMHVRGRPGAHLLIPLQPGKTAPLETLLDAANLCVYYSGGEGWGKTEVDYTFKKYVRRIKDSTEASYTNNKTLLIQPDPERLKRLLAQLAAAKPTSARDS